MKQTIFLIGNPAAGKNALRKINEAAAIIKNKGHDVEMLLTGKRGDAESFARQISRQSTVESHPPTVPPLVRGGLKGGYSNPELLIIAAGGDGTYNEVINGIACTNIPMAILPLGTTNVLAKELNIPDDIEKAVDIALNGKIHTVCLGKITSNPPSPLTRHFLLMAGIGYDGETVYGIKKGLKKYSGKGAYILSGLKTLMRWAPDKLTFTMDGKSCEGYSAIICKTSKYAGNFRIAPDADINKNNLYAFIMHSRNRLDILRYISGILTKKHFKFKDITYQQAENIEVKGNAHIQIDGDYFGMTPARIEIAPDALRLVY
ncbi:MAG: diacylglycerol kinase family lipid kinase [Nitrospirota bacterium]|nr:diacylglycerol kinase family lipid kinase [Nitrospirota bacterium]